uniref:UPAR/Ly6 domain-containing protein n=1 Tax=Steinernema glaseri TaxID=37863 RepID=A0A1I7YUM0_9BILA
MKLIGHVLEFPLSVRNDTMKEYSSIHGIRLMSPLKFEFKDLESMATLWPVTTDLDEAAEVQLHYRDRRVSKILHLRSLWNHDETVDGRSVPPGRGRCPHLPRLRAVPRQRSHRSRQCASGRYHGTLFESSNLKLSFQATNCDKCIAVKESNRLIVGCLKEPHSPQLFNGYTQPECPPGSYDFKCNADICCCHGEYCFDQLRKFFSAKKPSGTVTCPVYRQPLDQFGKLSSAVVPADQKFSRSTCAICNARKDSSGVEFQCVEIGDTDEYCKSKTNYVGGALACDVSGADCCCRGPTCKDDYERLFSALQMPQPSVKEAYSRGTSNFISIWTVLLTVLLSVSST